MLAIRSSLKMIGTYEQIYALQHNAVIVDQEGQMLLNMQAICPLQHDDPELEWGVASAVLVRSVQREATYIEWGLQSEDVLIGFVFGISRRNPDIVFLYRALEVVEGRLHTQYLLNGAAIYDGGSAIYNVDTFFRFPNTLVLIQVRWSADLNAWQYLHDHLLPSNTQELIQQADLMPPNDFIWQMEHQMRDDDQDPYNDGASDRAIANLLDYEDYGDEEVENASHSDDDSEVATIAPFQGQLTSDDLCSICVDTPSNPQLTSCGHLYCSNCIQTWLSLPQSRSKCPNCKRNIV